MSLQGFDVTALDNLNPGLGLVMQTSGCSPGGVEEFLWKMNLTERRSTTRNDAHSRVAHTCIQFSCKDTWSNDYQASGVRRLPSRV